MYWVILASLILACLAICLLAHCRKPHVDLSRFQTLASKWQMIAAEARAVGTSPTPRVRTQTDWGKGLDDFMVRLGSNTTWITAWATDGKWDNYPLVVNGRVANEAASLCPGTCRLLLRIPGVRIAGFSKVRAGGRIQPHTDADAGSSHGRAACHLCLEGTSTLWVAGNRIDQVPGRLLGFDPERKHQVVNDTDSDRVLLYINFDLLSSPESGQRHVQQQHQQADL